MTGHVLTAGRRLVKLEALHTHWVCPQCQLPINTPLPSREVSHLCGSGITATTVNLVPKEG